jgi:hypothetical protein
MSPLSDSGAVEGRAPCSKPPPAQVTSKDTLDKSEPRVDWRAPSEEISFLRALVRALSVWPT